MESVNPYGSIRLAFLWRGSPPGEYRTLGELHFPSAGSENVFPFCLTYRIIKPWMMCHKHTLFAAEMSQASDLYNYVHFPELLRKYTGSNRAVFTVNTGLQQMGLYYKMSNLTHRTKMYLCGTYAGLWWLPIRPKTNSTSPPKINK